MRLPRAISALTVVGLTFGVPILWSQNLGDIARQDRERRSRLSSHAPVLTNDDLERDRILTPELRNRILRTQAGNGAGLSADAPLPVAVEQIPPPLTSDMLQQVRHAAVQPLPIEAVQPAVLQAATLASRAPVQPAIDVAPPAAAGAETLASRTPSYTDPAVALAAAAHEPLYLGEYRLHSAVVQPLELEVIQPAVETQALASAVPSPAPVTDVIEPAPVTATLPPRAPAYTDLPVDIIQPAALETQALASPMTYSAPEVATAGVNEPVSLGEYARQLRAYRQANAPVQPFDPATAEPAVVAHQQEVSLGNFARQLRAARLERLDLQAPDVVQTAAAAQPDNRISLGEYARQLQLRFSAQALPVSAPAAQASAADPGQPVSLGEYARESRALRTVPAYESASLTPLPPRAESRVAQPEMSLGEYARQLRMRQSAEQYMRLLAEDDPGIAAVLSTSNAAMPYPEIHPAAPAPALRQPALVARVAEPKKTQDGTLALQDRIAVTVRRGDSLWRLARLYLGSGARWQTISFLNRHRGSPDLIYAGEVVLIPVVDPQRPYGTQLAKRFLGRRTR